MWLASIVDVACGLASVCTFAYWQPTWDIKICAMFVIARMKK